MADARSSCSPKSELQKAEDMVFRNEKYQQPSLVAPAADSPRSPHRADKRP